MIRRVGMAWERFWFAPSSYNPLGLLRIALLGYILWHELGARMLQLFWASEMPRSFMDPGIPLRHLPIPFPLPEGTDLLFEAGMYLFGICAAAGLLTRPALALFTLGYIYLAAVDSAWGWHDHRPSLVVQVLVVLIVSPGTDSFSLDRAVRWALYHRSGARRAPFLDFLRGPAVPVWGIRLILVTMSLMYFVSGFAKLRHGGIEWMEGEPLAFYLSGKSISNQMQQFASREPLADAARWKDGFGVEYYLFGANPSGLARKLSESPLLCALGAAGAVLLELSYPLILIPGWPRTITLVGGAFFHAVISIMMSIPFFAWLVIDLSMIEWRWLASRLRLTTRSRSDDQT